MRELIGGGEFLEYEISKIDAAVEQLDWAIKLFLDHHAYVPAITLAGAADEILGKAVVGPSTHQILKEKFSAEYGVSEKIVSDEHLNRARNWLKHWDGAAETEKTILELDEEALQMIARALANLISHDRSLPSEGHRFLDWVLQNRPNGSAER